MHKFIKFFDEIHIKDVPLVGGKNASLGEMYNELVPKGIRVPNGFAITADAYRQLLKESGIAQQIKAHLSGFDVNNLDELSTRGEKIRNLILGAKIPQDIEAEIKKSYQKICEESGVEIAVAVRSSATAEDLPDASFAGQQETYLNVRGEIQLLEACQKCFASLFTNRATSYRVNKGFDHLQVALSIGVQKMVRSDLASSGVIFTLDTESGFRDVVLITSAYGLGENIVQGVVTPDEFYVFKPTLLKGKQPILDKKLGSKEIKMIYNTRGGTKSVRNVPVSVGDREVYSISDAEILQLARWAVLIEQHYKRPMDIEWGKDGETGEMYILQARPETIHVSHDASILETYSLDEKGSVLVTGKAIGSKVGQGKAHIIRDVKDIVEFKAGDVLVTEMTDPDWVPVMKKASAIVTERGGRTCHAAIVSRELGLPAIVGAEYALSKIKPNQDITVFCCEGEEAHVYDGLLKFNKQKIALNDLKTPPVPIMMNLAQPELAFKLSFLPNQGVGLARMEFIISESIRIHPMALLNHPHLKDAEAIATISELTKGYKTKSEYFIEKLSHGVARIAAAFYPKDVILRFSDFKTNEYAGLIGGQEFEPVEENPMIGFRGASRYYDERYKAGFAMECEAVKRVRDDMGLTNLKVMIPFCRTVEEAKKVQAEMAKNSLSRGQNGLEIYMMCEIPSNVILADEFAKLFDGFSIGSNDLTQLTLGLDRDSQIVAHLFDERNEAVKRILHMAIQAAKKSNTKIGICGQAPSDYPEFTKFLIEEGIDSLSLNPDAIVKTLISLNRD